MSEKAVRWVVPKRRIRFLQNTTGNSEDDHILDPNLFINKKLIGFTMEGGPLYDDDVLGHVAYKSNKRGDLAWAREAIRAAWCAEDAGALRAWFIYADPTDSYAIEAILLADAICVASGLTWLTPAAGIEAGGQDWSKLINLDEGVPNDAGTSFAPLNVATKMRPPNEASSSSTDAALMSALAKQKELGLKMVADAKSMKLEYDATPGMQQEFGGSSKKRRQGE